jgi:hypothetical protein
MMKDNNTVVVRDGGGFYLQMRVKDKPFAGGPEIVHVA